MERGFFIEGQANTRLDSAKKLPSVPGMLVGWPVRDGIEAFDAAEARRAKAVVAGGLSREGVYSPDTSQFYKSHAVPCQPLFNAVQHVLLKPLGSRKARRPWIF